MTEEASVYHSLNVEETLKMFGETYHNLKFLEIDEDIIEKFVKNFAEDWEVTPDDEEEDKIFRIYMKSDNTLWNSPKAPTFRTYNEARDHLINFYSGMGTFRELSNNPWASNYYAKNYTIREDIR